MQPTTSRSPADPSLSREFRAPIHLAPTISGLARNIVRVCSWCKKIHWNESIWLDMDQAAPLLQRHPSHPKPDVSHGICEECKTALLIEAP